MPDLSNLSDEELLAMHAKAVAQPAVAAAPDLSKLSDDELLAMHARATAPNPPPSSDSIVDPEMLKAAAMGAYQGATMNFGDEIGGGLGTVHDYVAKKMSGEGGDFDWGNTYHKNRDEWRQADEDLGARHPLAHGLGAVGGALGTSFIPGLGLLNAGKGAGLIEMGVKGALQGGLAGAGDAKEFTDIPADAAHGAKWGAGIGTTLGVAGKVGGAVLDAVKPARVASVLLNVPEEAVQSYIKSPEAVNAARPRAEIVQDFVKRVQQLKDEVISGSQASRETLASEGQTVSGNDLADIFDKHADEIAQRAEGVMDDPQTAAAYHWLRNKAKQYRPRIPGGVSDDLAAAMEHARASGDPIGTDLEHIAAMGRRGDDIGLAGQFMESAQLPKGMSAREALEAEADRQLSTNRVKDLVQSLQRRTQYETAPGQFADVDDLIRQRVAGDVNATLKAQSPAYAEQMKGVAKDASLLSDVGDLAKSPQGFDNLLKRTQRGNTPHLMDSLNQFDQRTGGGMMSELQNSAVKDALDRGATNGSRNVNLHKGIAESIGEGIGGLPGKLIGKTVGVLGGATVDKYGPAIAKGTVDTAAKLQSMLNSSEGLQTLGQYAGPLMDAAKRGNQSLAVTHFLLSQKHPDYAQTVNGK
jgi:hypothetical protein